MRINVRALAEFFCEGGDICPGSPTAMREGVRAHQKRQAEYGEDLRREVPLSGEYVLPSGILSLYGRADGVRRDGDEWEIEEIKWTGRTLTPEYEGENVHLLQACLYALLLCDEQGLSGCGVCLRYMDGQGGSVALPRHFTRDALYGMMAEAGEAFLSWTLLLETGREARMASARELPFPFDRYREGQQKLARNAYVALRDGKYLVCEAPTGLGKTMAALFAAVRAWGEGRVTRVFFLTARGTGKTAAEDALRRMEARGFSARRVTLRAKRDVCVLEEPWCDGEHCPRACGYYDRKRDAIQASLSENDWNSERIDALAEKYGLCPFELSLDLAETADVVIGDYNYAFDPRVRLSRFFEGRTGAALLVDETHNLPDRAREMYSAFLKDETLREDRREAGKTEGRKSKVYRAMSEYLKWRKGCAAPNGLSDAVDEDAAARLETMIAAMEAGGQTHRDSYWDGLWLLRALRSFDPDCDRLLMRKDMWGVRCMEPGLRLQKVLEKTCGAVFFSATLTPLAFYRDRLGVTEADSALLSLRSPFPPENLTVRLASLSTRYTRRERTLPALAALIARFAAETEGNILVCFPSYAYLEAVRAIFVPDEGHTWQFQTPNMDDAARREFLVPFETAGRTGAFVTLGGLFTEGIDLAGERLVGAVIVGTGLPAVCEETEQLRAWYEEKEGSGFACAYVYPGVARVVQAAGRVIRTAEDKGRVLLIDDRWTEPMYNSLLPAWWKRES